MPFIALTNGSTISADDFRNNYEYIGVGNRLPYGGASLDPTGSVYDLGSDIYKWNNAHIRTINLSGEIDRVMNLISEVNVTATAAAITISGLNSSTDKYYEIICNIKAYATCNVWMFPNQDSNTANYGRQNLIAVGATISGTRETSITGVVVSQLGYDTITALYSKTELKITCVSSSKLMLTSILNGGGNYVRYLYQDGQIWNNSATITSMLFTGYFDAGTNIQIWAKR